MDFQKLFLEYCSKKNFEINQNQVNISNELHKFHKENFNRSIFSKIFKRKNQKLGFYLFGGVGVGKTMTLNLFFKEVKEKKLRQHFNEFMINFHDFIFRSENKENGINNFVKDLNSKADIIYFDEFQVTNIVDAMILGKLFQKIFEENIKVIFTSNISINNLYKDGLQRDQFKPFIKILEHHCHENLLKIDEDYRTSNNLDYSRYLYPYNQSTNFSFNKFLRKITKNKKKTLKKIEIKGRSIKISNYYEGIAKFNFKDLCEINIGSEDYINIAEICDFIFINGLPNFNENNSNHQQRFITLIDILYEKKIPLTILAEVNLKDLKSSFSLKNQFKRTVSRLHELTSIDYN